MHWYITAPFSTQASDQWLGRYVPGTRHSFSSVPIARLHDRSRKYSGSAEWRDYFGQGLRAWAQARKTPASGIITCFPQLPVTVGLCRALLGGQMPLVAWTFNLGQTPSGIKRRVSRYALSQVARFIVHSTHEVEAYSRWLALPEERFVFVPLQRALLSPQFTEDEAQPYVVAMGSAQRDYKLLVEALRPLRYRTIIVAGPHAVAGIDLPEHVELRSNLSIEACHELVQKACVSVIPVANQETASGQVTLIDSMMFAKPTIVTRCPGSVDYVRDGHDALLVPPGDVAAMTAAIEGLWRDETARQALGAAARQTVVDHFCDEAIGRRMGELLDSLA